MWRLIFPLLSNKKIDEIRNNSISHPQKRTRQHFWCVALAQSNINGYDHNF